MSQNGPQPLPILAYLNSAWHGRIFNDFGKTSPKSSRENTFQNNRFFHSKAPALLVLVRPNGRREADDAALPIVSRLSCLLLNDH